MAYKIPRHRPVRLTTQQWHADLLTHVPPTAWRLSREDILELRKLRRPIRPGAMPKWDQRLSVDELVMLLTYRGKVVTAGAVDFVTRMPYELTAQWMGLDEQAREMAKRLA